MGKRASLKEMRVAYGGGSHDDRVGAALQQPRHGRLRPNTARDLKLHLGLTQDLLDQRRVARGAARRVEIDDVDPLRSCLRIPLRDGHRIVAIDGRLVVTTLREADRLSAQDVDRGNYVYR
jgi:hypothetical protein